VTDEFTGRTLSRKFTLRRRIGAGGMATVYEALNLQIEAQVAIKILRPEFFKHDTLSIRFQREAKSAAKMRHPHIVQVLDYDVDEDVPYIVMEYLEGCTLSELQQNLGPLPWQRVADITAQVCLALEYAHSHNVLHRDIKPSNVFLLADANGRDIIKLLDFGIAKVQQPLLPEGEPLTSPSQIPGTPEYMAPEQAQGEGCEARTDLYSLGVMMYRLVTGRLPFYAATPTETLAQHVLRTPTPPSVLMPDLEIPPAFEAIIMKALAKRPDQRWDSARAFREALIGHQSDPAEPTQIHTSRRSSASNAALFDASSITAFSLQGFEWRDRLLRIRRAAAMLSGASLGLVAFMFLSLFPLPGVATIAGGPELPPEEEPLPPAPKTPPPASITPDALKQAAAIAPATTSTPTQPSTSTPTPTPTPPPSDVIIVDDTPPTPPPLVRVRPPPSPRRVIETYIKNHRNSFSKCSEMIPFGQGATFTVDLSVEPATGRALSAIVEESLRSKDYVTCAISVLQSFKYPRFVGDGQLKGMTINI
jgi:serine/threonine protein kinase